MKNYLDFFITFFFEVDSFTFFMTFWSIIVVAILRHLFSIGFSSWAILFSKNTSISALRFKGEKHSSGGVSIILASHNTDREIIQTVLSLREQTAKKIQIIVVNDGSTDYSESLSKSLLHQKIIDHYIHLNVRSGKAAALNAGLEFVKYKYTMFCDTGTTFHRDAIEISLGYFDNPQVGAVSCGIGVRNSEQNLLTFLQKMHYFISCIVSRNALNFMGLQFVISGAFGIFRTDVLKTIGGHFPGTGEDLELTMRMRWLGWKVEFAYYSMALTDVPDNIKSFIKQTLRWDRDGIKTVYQKFAPHVVNPFSKHFNLMMAISVLDNFFVGWILIVMTYMFFIYLAASKGEGVILFTVVVYIFLIFIEFFSVLLTLLFVNKFDRDWRYLYYVPLYVLLKMFFYEPIRFISIWSELIFRHSYKDSFSPYKVQKILKDERG